VADEDDAQSAADATGTIGAVLSIRITPAASRSREILVLMVVNIMSLLLAF